MLAYRLEARCQLSVCLRDGGSSCLDLGRSGGGGRDESLGLEYRHVLRHGLEHRLLDCARLRHENTNTMNAYPRRFDRPRYAPRR